MLNKRYDRIENKLIRKKEYNMKEPRIYQMSFGSVYPLYVKKVEKKGRTQAEVDEVISWLTGYSAEELSLLIEEKKTFKEFFDDAPQIHPNANLIKGVICGYRVEELEEPLMRHIRYMDKLIDELAKGKKMEKILRSSD